VATFVLMYVSSAGQPSQSYVFVLMPVVTVNPAPCSSGRW
jgi:hypothetical protein